MVSRHGKPRGESWKARARECEETVQAVAIVVFGSLAGEYAGARGWLGEGLWFWLGHQGWEYLDLGRLWQILLIVGLFLWVFILFRGL
ncbi:MAG TPA: hypothetical protein VFS84_10460, partial [Candidatus Binatia bacterium]|nr:hypothetical protein [Candidatus Binatia bacterium]